MNMLDHSLGHLARQIPGAMALFRAHGLDFCWAGAQTLRAATEQNHLDGQGILRELQALQANPLEAVHWDQATDDALIEYILTRYHDRHRQQFPVLIKLSHRVELLHGGHPQCPWGLTRYLEQLQFQLEVHMRKEEQILFPMITRGMRGLTRGPMGLMREEHDHQGAILQRLSELTHGFVAPDDASGTWRTLYSGLETLQQDLIDHTHLENNVLFERVDRRLAEAV